MINLWQINAHGGLKIAFTIQFYNQFITVSVSIGSRVPRDRLGGWLQQEV